MSSKSPEKLHLRPSKAASLTHALCTAINDLVQEEGSDMSRRTYLKVCGLAAAAEMFSDASARFHFNLMGEDHDQLEAIEDRWSST